MEVFVVLKGGWFGFVVLFASGFQLVSGQAAFVMPSGLQNSIFVDTAMRRGLFFWPVGTNQLRKTTVCGKKVFVLLDGWQVCAWQLIPSRG